MSRFVDVLLLSTCLLATSVWIGGYVAVAVVAQTAARTLDAAQRVGFFRVLGRAYLPIGLGALFIAIGSGAALARHVGWSVLLLSVIAALSGLVACLMIAVAQARRMTGLRTCLLATPEDGELAHRVDRAAAAATTLRALVGILSIAVVVLAACLAI